MKEKQITITILNTDKHERDVPYLLEKIQKIANTFTEAYEGMRVDVEENHGYFALTWDQRHWSWEHDDTPITPPSDDQQVTRIVCQNTLKLDNQ